MSGPKELYQSKLKQMTLREKIGQMLLCGFHGTEVAGDVESFLRMYPIGGVIYFARNVESPEQVERLSSGLQQIAKATVMCRSGYPLIRRAAWLLELPKG